MTRASRSVLPGANGTIQRIGLEGKLASVCATTLPDAKQTSNADSNARQALMTNCAATAETPETMSLLPDRLN
jgi:hypothetical protein